MEPERWKTTRRCPECLHKPNGDTNYLWAQPWGEDEKGNLTFKLDCWDGKCGYSEQTKWNGK